MGGGDERKGETVGGEGASFSTATNGDGKRQRAAVPAGARVRGASAATAAATPRQSASSLVPTTTTITVWLVAVDAGDLATTSVFSATAALPVPAAAPTATTRTADAPRFSPAACPVSTTTTAVGVVRNTTTTFRGRFGRVSPVRAYAGRTLGSR